MNRDDIIRMAREAGFETAEEWDKFPNGFVQVVARFAALVSAAAKEEMLMAGNDQWLEEARKAEREACAKVCESLFDLDDDSCSEAEQCAAAIRARGQA